MSPTVRRLALPIVLLVVGLPIGIVAMIATGGHDAPKEASQAFMPISQRAVARAERHAQPRWEQVATFTGAGATERPFTVAAGASQWKADWRCSVGTLSLSVGRSAGASKPLTTSSCPDAGSELSSGDGPGRLRVQASGSWSVIVQQQVDTALREPPLPGMTGAALLARGRVRPIQKQGEGTVSLYRLGSGRLALRFEDFYTSPSPGLELWLSRARNPRSTLDARDAQHVNVGTPRSTFGSYNQVLPQRVGVEQVKSVVLWCPAVTIAFSAASLVAS